MMLDHDLATVMTKLFKAVFQADIKASNSFSKNKHLIRATFYFTHFFIICTQNKVLIGLSFPELVNFLEAIFAEGEFPNLCTEDFFNSTNLSAGTGTGHSSVESTDSEDNADSLTVQNHTE